MPAEVGRVGYVLKKYPRLSETFILSELLGLEALGVDVSVYSLRLPDDGRFHADLARLRAPVRYLPPFGGSTVMGAMRSLAGGAATAGQLGRALAFVDRLPPERQATTLLDALHLARLAREDGVRHLHAHFLTVAAHVAYLTHLFTGLPYSVTTHAKDIYRTTVDPALFAEVARNATAVVTVCDAARRHVAGALAGPGANVVRIYNGLDLDAFAAAPAPREQGLVLAVGRLVEKKGFEVLLDACSLLARRGASFRCVIVGDGDQEAALRARADRPELRDRVVFAGPLPRHEVLAWMRRAGVLAAPFVVAADGNRDSLPTVVLEAMAVGLPVVTTPIGGVPEMVEHGRQGLLVPESDVPALAEALHRVLVDARLGAAMAEAGPRRVAACFDRRQTAAELAAVFGTGPGRTEERVPA